jgi:hypothetical protein
VSDREEIVPVIRMTNGWMYRLERAPAISRYLFALAFAAAAQALSHQLNHQVLPWIVATAASAYLCGFGPGVLTPAAALILALFEEKSLSRPNAVEIATACSILAWAISSARKFEREKILSEAKLQESQLMLNRIPVGVYCSDSEGSIFAVNEWLLQYTGLGRGVFEDKSGAFAERQQRQEQLMPEERERVIQKWLAVRET